MAKLYTNENIPLAVVTRLREHGHDVLTSLESGKANQRISDADVLTFAAQEQRALITFNRKHFIRLHQESSDHAGIVVCTVDANFAGLADRIDQAISEIPDLAGQLIRVSRPQS